MWRRKYADNLYHGLLKTLREVEFDRRQRQRPIYTEVLDENTDEEENSTEETEETGEEENPLDRPFINRSSIVVSENNLIPFTELCRSRRIAAMNE